MTSRLCVTSLDAGYAGVPVIRGLTLSIARGEVVTLLGPNGAGKTSTLLTIAGELPALAGSVTLDGSPLTGPLFRRARSGVALVTEDSSALRTLTTRQNLRLGRGSAEAALSIFPELEEHLDRPAGLLSGGQQKMLALGRALAGAPKVLLADELSLGLAPMVTRRLLQAVRAAADDGMAVLLVEQHAALALRYADRGCVIARGSLQLQGTAQSLAADLDSIEASYLSQAPVVAG